MVRWMDRWIYWHTNPSIDIWVWIDRKKDLRGGQKGQGQGTYRMVHNLDYSREEARIQGEARLVSGRGQTQAQTTNC